MDNVIENILSPNKISKKIDDVSLESNIGYFIIGAYGAYASLCMMSNEPQVRDYDLEPITKKLSNAGKDDIKGGGISNLSFGTLLIMLTTFKMYRIGNPGMFNWRGAAGSGNINEFSNIADELTGDNKPKDNKPKFKSKAKFKLNIDKLNVIDLSDVDGGESKKEKPVLFVPSQEDKNVIFNVPAIEEIVADEDPIPLSSFVRIEPPPRHKHHDAILKLIKFGDSIDEFAREESIISIRSIIRSIIRALISGDKSAVNDDYPMIIKYLYQIGALHTIVTDENIMDVFSMNVINDLINAGYNIQIPRNSNKTVELILRLSYAYADKFNLGEFSGSFEEPELKRLRRKVIIGFNKVLSMLFKSNIDRSRIIIPRLILVYPVGYLTVANKIIILRDYIINVLPDGAAKDEAIKLLNDINELSSDKKKNAKIVNKMFNEFMNKHRELLIRRLANLKRKEQQN